MPQIVNEILHQIELQQEPHQLFEQPMKQMEYNGYVWKKYAKPSQTDAVPYEN